jgi:hypothetical protein
VASVGEAEYAALFATGQHAASLRTTLADMGYPQDPTIIMCDNTSTIGIPTDSIKQKRSKAVDMRFNWIRDRVRQEQFIIAYYIYPNATKPGRLLHQNITQKVPRSIPLSDHKLQSRVS